MTKQNINFIVDFNDKPIRERLEEDAYNDILEYLKQDFVDSMPKLDTWKSWGMSNEVDKIDWKCFAQKAVKDIVEENDDKIIDLAAKKLCDSFRRTKIFKETMVEKLNDILEEE